jgi:6-pyruvoyltetrahydropterin/6-carboxytetrahydropterin synthase
LGAQSKVLRWRGHDLQGMILAKHGTFACAYNKNELIMVYLTRVERFNAAHKLWVNEWSEEQNFQMFGKCSNPNWHGHNYYLHVTVKGQPDPVLGFVFDAKKLSVLVKSEVLDHLDHRNINLDVSFFPKTQQPTTENLVVAIWNQLVGPIAEQGATLHCIKLYETETIYAEYFG